MSDSIWQHNVTKGTIPPPKKTSYFDLIYIYIFAQHWRRELSDDLMIFGHLWARQQLDWQQSLLKSLLLWLRASQAHPGSMCVPATMPFRWITCLFLASSTTYGFIAANPMHWMKQRPTALAILLACRATMREPFKSQSLEPVSTSANTFTHRDSSLGLQNLR